MTKPKKKINYFLFIPPTIFFALAAMFYLGLQRENPGALPSALIGREVPNVNLTDLRTDPAPVDADFRASNVKLVNFWASWCGPCRAEAPLLERMAKEMGIPILGINYKDQPQQALAFLEELGDPFIKIGADSNGRNSIDWGVTGIPETFVVDENGIILFRYPGPITTSILNKRILPLLNGETE
ncbi:MAG: DsbE family thiol:disulfide interchange protein [Rhodobacteraceae bacterium]|nr:DsbE family thiol:disulfide interchange protein [Paracoccaceae bacterium]